MATTKTATPTSTFTNNRWMIDSNTRVSVSHWQDGKFFYSAIALVRKTAQGWKIDHSTAVEMHNTDEEDCAFRATDYAAKLVKGILGDAMPLRFFRDNVVA